MVNPAIEGKIYPRTPSYLVGREKIREFAKAVFSNDPANLDLEAAKKQGYKDLIAPPTFAVVIQERSLTQVICDNEAVLDFPRGRHGDQRIIHVRPIVGGDELNIEIKVARVKQVTANSMVSFESQIFE